MDRLSDLFGGIIIALITSLFASKLGEKSKKKQVNKNRQSLPSPSKQKQISKYARESRTKNRAMTNRHNLQTGESSIYSLEKKEEGITPDVENALKDSLEKKNEIVDNNYAVKKSLSEKPDKKLDENKEKQDFRKAFIYSEIFGKPKAFEDEKF